jgi:Fur family ferric uptake transcriptional regulator
MEVGEYLQNILKKHDKFFTSQRKVILEELNKMTSHPTAEELYLQVKKRLPKVSLGTVYRNLQTMEELKLVDKLVLKIQGEARYEIHKQPHYHVVCTKCYSIKDLGSFRSVSLEPTAQKLTGYFPLTHDVTIFGICPACKL